MNNNKTTKKALLSSIISIVLCLTMLLGTTFAWFTDTVSTGSNVIQSGILKIDMEHQVGNEWVSLKDNPTHEVISKDILWEPGYAALATIRVVNKGNLALKYRLNLTIAAGEGQKLGDVIDVYTCVGTPDASSRPDLTDASVWKKVGTLNELAADADGAARGILLPVGATPKRDGEVVEVATATILLHMREEAGNEYQGLDLGAVYMDLLATQYTFEEDSFDDQYDADAKFPATTMKTGEELSEIIKGQDPAKVTKIVFGVNGTYTDEIAGIDGINADALDKGTVKVYRVPNADGTVTVYVLSDSKIYFNEDSSSAFREFTNLEEVVTTNTDFSLVKNASAMFYNNAKLKKVDVSKWDTSNVELANHMFYNCSQLAEIDVANWDTGKVTNMKSLFAGCSAATELAVAGWDTSSVTDMSFMFNKCIIESLDLSGWNTENVTTMKCLFQNCKKLTEVNVEGWDTSKVEDFGWLFQNAEAIKKVDLSSWDTSSATKMNNLFCHAHALEEVDISTWNVEKVTDFSNMLQYTKVKNIDVSQWKTPSAITMTHMFANNGNLESLDLSNFDTRNVTDMWWMFYAGHSMTKITVGENWTTEKVENKDTGVFYECYNLVGGNGTTWVQAKESPDSKIGRLAVAVPDMEGQPGLLTKK